MGITLALLSLTFSLEKENLKIQNLSLEKTLEIKEAISRELLISQNVLRGVEGLFHSSNYVSRKEFQLFCRNSIHDEAQIQLIEWQPKVSSKERRRIEKLVEQDGFKGFQFFEINKDNKEVPAKKRDFHFPVLYSYSPISKKQAIGLDLAFSPERMESKFISMKTGKPSISETFNVILKGKTERLPGFAVTKSIFKDSSVSSAMTLEPLRGFVAAVIYVKDFFTPISNNESLQDFQFQVHDVFDDNKLIYSTYETTQENGDYQTSLSFDVGAREWKLTVSPKQDFILGERSSLPYIVSSLIFLLSLTLSFYFFLKVKDNIKFQSYQRQIQQKQKLESLGVLVSGIAHEFNNILHCITLATERLSDSPTKDDVEESRKIALDYCQKGEALVRQILSFARKDTGSYQEVLPSKEIKEVLNLMGTTFGKEIHFETNLQEDGDRPLMMNPGHISQILFNLINNSVHALENKGTIIITYQVNQENRSLAVKDHGHGMRQEVIDRIFDPFFSTKAINEGTGLGMSVIYGIVKSYQGQIEVFSQPQKGTEIKITFPL